MKRKILLTITLIFAVLSATIMPIMALSRDDFGLSFFKHKDNFKRTISAGAAPENYLLGPGDELRVIVWSDLGDETVYDIKINHENQAYIPILGVIGVAGMTVDEFKKIVIGKLAHKFRHFKGQITLTKVRTIQVYVVGEVEHPGAMTISGLATAFDALYKSGGPTDRGSMRNIKVLKSSGKSFKIDLYRYFLNGDRSQDVSLSDGDTIFVPVYKAKVTVKGMVVRPAKYEITKPVNLKTILAMAGNPLAQAYSGAAQVTRWTGNKRRKIFTVNLKSEKQLQKFMVKNGDVIEVVKGIETVGNEVKITGAIAKPGTYAVFKNTRVRDIIKKAGGIIKENATLKYGRIYRKTTEGKEKIISFNPRWALIGDKKNNVILKPFDRIKIFNQDEIKADIRTVNIEGAVRRPGEYIFRNGMKLSDIIYKAKGLSVDASGDAEVARIVGNKTSIIKAKATLALKNPGSKDDIILKPLDRVSILARGDTLITPEVVVIKGQVKRPGPYAIKFRGEKLSSLIKRAGGLTRDAFPEGAVFMRRVENITSNKQLETAQTVQSEMFKQASLDLRADLLRSGAKISDMSAVQKTTTSGENAKEQIIGMAKTKDLLNKNQALKSETSKYSGVNMQSRGITNKLVRIPIPLTQILSGKADKYDDIELLDGDQITIPIIPTTVSVLGAVVNPTTLMYKRNRSVRYYISRAGGFSTHSNHAKTVIVRANGEVYSLRNVRRIYRGDIILVPPKARLVRQNKIKQISDIAKILGNMAITYDVIHRNR